MPNSEFIKAAMEKGIITADLTLAKLIEADQAVGAVDGAESGDIGIGPLLVFRPPQPGKAIKQEHVEALAGAGLINRDVTLAELVDLAGDGGEVAAAELVGTWFVLRQLPQGLGGAEVIQQ